MSCHMQVPTSYINKTQMLLADRCILVDLQQGCAARWKCTHGTVVMFLQHPAAMACSSCSRDTSHFYV